MKNWYDPISYLAATQLTTYPCTFARLVCVCVCVYM